MRTYVGEFVGGAAVCTVYEGSGWYPLPIRTDLVAPPPRVPTWGCSSPGTDLLAVSIVSDATRYENLAMMLGTRALAHLLEAVSPGEEFAFTDDLVVDQVLRLIDGTAEHLAQQPSQQHLFRAPPSDQKGGKRNGN